MQGRSAAPLLVAAAALAGCERALPDEPPVSDIVLIVVDTLRADHLSGYGYHRPTDGPLESFQARATRFADCHASAPWTTPSVASLMTGLFPVRHRTDGHGSRLPDAAHTLAEALHERGWYTSGISFNPNVSKAAAFGQGFDAFDDVSGDAKDYPDIAEMRDRLASVLDDRPERPLFLYLQPMNVHGPYKVPKGHRRGLLGRLPASRFVYYGGRMKAILRRAELERRADVTPTYLESLVEQYDTAVHYTAVRLDEIFDMLEQKGVYDDALIIVTSDHGEELFEHGGFSHGFSLHEEVLSVPLYVKLPGQQRARTITDRVSLLDLYPTILELAGLTPPEDLDGRSLAPLLRGDEPGGESEDRALLAHTAWKERCRARSITVGDYKLVQITSNYEGLEGVERLYDLASDPGEETDLAARHPDVVERLGRELEARFARMREQALEDAGTAEMDIERMKALGYVDGDQEEGER